MAKVESITIQVNAAPAIIGIRFAVWLLRIGAPVWLGFIIARYCAWVRLSHGTSRAWDGWTWVGRDMRLSDG